MEMFSGLYQCLLFQKVLISNLPACYQTKSSQDCNVLEILTLTVK